MKRKAESDLCRISAKQCVENGWLHLLGDLLSYDEVFLEGETDFLIVTTGCK